MAPHGMATTPSLAAVHLLDRRPAAASGYPLIPAATCSSIWNGLKCCGMLLLLLLLLLRLLLLPLLLLGSSQHRSRRPNDPTTILVSEGAGGSGTWQRPSSPRCPVRLVADPTYRRPGTAARRRHPCFKHTQKPPSAQATWDLALRVTRRRTNRTLLSWVDSLSPLFNKSRTC